VSLSLSFEGLPSKFLKGSWAEGFLKAAALFQHGRFELWYNWPQVHTSPVVWFANMNRQSHVDLRFQTVCLMGNRRSYSIAIWKLILHTCLNNCLKSLLHTTSLGFTAAESLRATIAIVSGIASDKLDN